MKRIGIMAALLGTSFLMSSCEIIGDIFQAGMGVGILLVVIVVALIFWLIRKVRR